MCILRGTYRSCELFEVYAGEVWVLVECCYGCRVPCAGDECECMESWLVLRTKWYEGEDVCDDLLRVCQLPCLIIIRNWLSTLKRCILECGMEGGMECALLTLGSKISRVQSFAGAARASFCTFDGVELFCTGRLNGWVICMSQFDCWSNAMRGKLCVAIICENPGFVATQWCFRVSG